MLKLNAWKTVGKEATSKQSKFQSSKLIGWTSHFNACIKIGIWNSLVRRMLDLQITLK